jgi:ankyrin repeat protein
MKLVLCTNFYPEAFEKLATINLDNINAQNSRGLTALHIAVAYSATASIQHTIQWLIDANVDVNAISDECLTPLHIGSLLSYSNNEIIKLLIDANADTNSRDDKGCVHI